MIDRELQELKAEGHRLLDEYVALEHRSWRKDRKLALRHAYEKLGFKLGGTKPNHFRLMTTAKEVNMAIVRLRRMIQKRKDRIDWLQNEKIEVAPNLRELQQYASTLNKP